MFNEAYLLEVSSPGLERPLKRERDYTRNLDKEINIKFFDANKVVQVEKLWKIQSASNDVVEFVKKDQTIKIPISSIITCKLNIDF